MNIREIHHLQFINQSFLGNSRSIIFIIIIIIITTTILFKR